MTDDSTELDEDACLTFFGYHSEHTCELEYRHLDKHECICGATKDI